MSGSRASWLTPLVVAAAVAAATAVALALWLTEPLPAMVAGLALALPVVALWPLNGLSKGETTKLYRRDSKDLALHHQRLRGDLAILQAAYELQHSVFEVSSELVSCVDEIDAHDRFAAALRTWWHCHAVDLFVWERGSWRSLGGEAAGEEPMLTGPVQLPHEGDGDLVLDLSPAVDGQAALVLRQAEPQPSLSGRSESDQRYVAEVLRNQLALSLRRVILFHELQRLGRIDPLTGCYRRWYGSERIHEQVERGLVMAVAMIDIDHFKAVNDTHGHGGGDAVLKGVGACLREQVRSGDLVCRWGGEEFVVCLPDTSAVGAMQVAERLRQSVSALSDLPTAVTVSIGVAACRMDETAEELINRADGCLYQAKGGGRNRVVLAEGDDASEPGQATMVRTTQRSDKRTTTQTDRSSFFKSIDGGPAAASSE